MTGPRDLDRTRVYRAEAFAFGQTLADESIGLAALTTLAGILFIHPWWVDATGGAMPRLRAARSDAGRSTASHSRDGTWTIRIVPHHDQAPTLSHEAAHVLVGTFGSPPREPVAAHGARFRAAHLDVATVLFGAHGRRLLDDGYRDAALDVETGPPWPRAPEPDAAHGILGDWRGAIAL